MAAAILKSEVAQPYHPEVETTENIFELIVHRKVCRFVCVDDELCGCDHGDQNNSVALELWVT